MSATIKIRSAAIEPVFQRRKYRFIKPLRESSDTLLGECCSLSQIISSPCQYKQKLASCQEQNVKSSLKHHHLELRPQLVRNTEV